MQEMRIPSLALAVPLKKEMATDSSILAWKIPWTEEPGRLIHWVIKSQTRLSMHACSSMFENCRSKLRKGESYQVHKCKVHKKSCSM